MRARQVAIAVDQLFNTLLSGYADETLSARAWRLADKKRRWAVLRRCIDGLFFWQSNHCFNSYINEVQRRHLPRDYKEESTP